MATINFVDAPAATAGSVTLNPPARLRKNTFPESLASRVAAAVSDSVAATTLAWVKVPVIFTSEKVWVTFDALDISGYISFL